MCASNVCINYAVGRHGFCANHHDEDLYIPRTEPQREHKLGCNEMHGHIAPACCHPDCWCVPKAEEQHPERNFEKDPNNALTRWEKISKKLTEDQRARIDVTISGLETCLKFAHSRMYLGLEAKSMLAWEFYKVDNTEDPPKPKGRREAIEHTRRQNEAEDE